MVDCRNCIIILIILIILVMKLNYNINNDVGGYIKNSYNRILSENIISK